jgi:eukaryotic-like serine/threonine-protein kinase
MLSARYGERVLIGEGASARVYKAFDTETKSFVAVKVLKPHLQTDRVSIERFRREIQVTRHLNHPRIVPIYDLVVEPDEAYLVMEYVDAPNLKETIRLHGGLECAKVQAILRQALEVLAVCHAKQVVHRDLKLENIIVDADGGVRLLDFGIAKMFALSDLTQTGASLGTPEYMAPELFDSNTFDPRTDIYAVGVIGFELLVGHPPFQGDSLAVLYHRHLTEPVPDLRSVRRDVPEWLQQVIERMLAKQPYARYQAAEEVLGDLDRRRVIARELPSLKKRECVHCGGQSFPELPVCVLCGYSAAEQATFGDYDVVCARDADDAKIEGYFRTVLGVQEPLRRRKRTLLLTGIDGLAAEMTRKSAAHHDVFLSVQKHPTYRELKKALPLAGMSLLGSLMVHSLLARFDYYGWYYMYEIRATDLLSLALPMALGVMCVRLFRKVEVLPVVSANEVLTRNVAREYGWLQRLAPRLKAERTETMQLFVSSLIEKYLLLRKFAPSLDADLRAALQQVVERATELADAVSEIEIALGSPCFVARSQEYARLACDGDGELDSAVGQDGKVRYDRLVAQMEAYYAIEEKYAALTNRLIQLQYVFNRLVGNELALRSPVDEQSRAILSDCAANLRADLAVSREVQAELDRLV